MMAGILASTIVVGNSGSTTEPHLHIHAIDSETGQGLPISFGGTIPVRNSIHH